MPTPIKSKSALDLCGDDPMSDEPIVISYGRGHIPIRLPTGARPTIVRKKPLPKLADPGAAITAALNAPVGSPSVERP